MAPADLGSVLRRARENHGLSIADVSARTNIPRRVLEQLETNALDDLPGGVIVRGYLRAFAREVRLDGEWLVRYAAPYLAPEIDVLDRLRERSRAASDVRAGHTDYGPGQLLFVFVCLACLFYMLTVLDTSSTGSASLPQEVSLDPPDAS